MNIRETQQAIEESLAKIEQANKTLMPLLLHQIRVGMQIVEQFKLNPYQHTGIELHVQSVARLEALVEVLEVFDCGSTGGFGKGFTGHGLKARATWLLEKYQ
jgi:hypothetical protein